MTFTIECECGTLNDIELSAADLADPDITHAVVCVDCETEMTFEYDAEAGTLIPVDEDEEDEEDESEDDGPVLIVEEEDQ